jgi:hypothetical protein
MRYSSRFSTSQAGLCPGRARRRRSWREVTTWGDASRPRPAIHMRPAPAAPCVFLIGLRQRTFRRHDKVTGFDTRDVSSSFKGWCSRSAVAGGPEVAGNASTKFCPGFDAPHVKLRGPVVRGSNPVRRVSIVGCCHVRRMLRVAFKDALRRLALRSERVSCLEGGDSDRPASG